jgi:NADPH:quinone reductase-like Zn-dependent oxidoreductase
VGGYAIQLARASGYTVITTASPHNHDYVKSLGADSVFDYREADAGSKIRNFTNGRLMQAVDCIASGDTPAKVSESLSAAGGKVAIVLPCQSARDEVEAKFALVYTLLGKVTLFVFSLAYGICVSDIRSQEMTKPYPYPAMPEHYQAGKEYAAILEQLLRSGKLKTTPVKITSKGLASVSEGIEYQKAGKVCRSCCSAQARKVVNFSYVRYLLRS